MKWKNIATETNTYFITATITDWQPLFNYETPRRILLDDLVFYKKKYNALIHAFVIMPDHYHLVIYLPELGSLHNWLRDIQSHSANEISKWLRNNALLDDAYSRMLEVFHSKAQGKAKLMIWKEQARAEAIISNEVFVQKINYIHANPVRRQLIVDPAEWPWSSWGAYYGDGCSCFQIDKPVLD